MSAAVRREDWAERLAAVLRAVPGRQHAYGDHDCALHACDGALAVTGDDPGAPYRGRYCDYMGGMRLLAGEAGTRSLEAWADSLFPRIQPSLAKRGDWALVRHPAAPGGRPHPALTIVEGERLCGPCGVRLPAAAGLICWRVG